MGEVEEEEEDPGVCPGLNLEGGGAEADSHVSFGGHQTLEELKARWAFFLRSKKMTSFSSPLPKGPGCDQVWDPLATSSCPLAGLGFLSLAM